MEKQYVLKRENTPYILRRGKKATFSFDGSAVGTKDKHRLFFTCEDVLTPSMKNESGAELLYMRIDDSLNTEMAERDAYCLDLSTRIPLRYPKRALKKIVFQPLIYGLYGYDIFTEYNDTWHFGIFAKARDLKVETEGYLRLRLDRWCVKEGVGPHDTREAPTETIFLDIPEGTYEYTAVEKTLTISPDDTACITVTLEGEGYAGDVFFEHPFFEDNEGRNLLPLFDRQALGLHSFSWLGQNLSKREWPRFRLSLNDTVFFENEIFLKVHRFSPIEIDIPNGLIKEGKNALTLTYTSDYPEAVPLAINELLLLSEENEEFKLLTPLHAVSSAGELKLLVAVASEECELSFESDDFCLLEETRFDDVFLRILSVKPQKAKNMLAFTLVSHGKKQDYTVKRCVQKGNDGVRAGSGDMIYVDISSKAAVVDFIKWYVSNGIGKLLTLRQVYRWGGTRFVDPEAVKIFTSLCDALAIDYVHLSDGRDIPGIATNPSRKMLEGEHFIGQQLHERDGQLFYWGKDCREVKAPIEEFFDLAARLGREHPDTVEGAMRPFNLSWRKGGCFYRRDLSPNSDIKAAHDLASYALRDLSLHGFDRHTGPSVMFKYFYQNGFEFAGFESMDGATEIPLSFLRGASSAYGKRSFGVHLALQWGTFPHDTEGRARRYLLSLLVPYIHGVTDLNTEEGLWYMEAFYAYHHRLSATCQRHREQLARFNRFVDTHTRTGTFYTPIAFLHGRLDGWDGFSSGKLFGMPHMDAKDMGASWKLFKLFYPLDACEDYGTGKAGYIPETQNKPFGFFSGTPYGCVDAVPVEAGNFERYRLLAFAGYNAATNEDLDRLEAFVQRGGTLLLSWPHLSDTTDKTLLDAHRHHVLPHSLTKLLSEGCARFVKDTAMGKALLVAENAVGEILQTTDNGRPLVTRIPYGNGNVILVNTLYYPGHPSVLPIYQDVLARLTRATLDSEPCKVLCESDVEYTIFRQEDGTRHYYFLAVDWYQSSNAPRRAAITIGENTYDISIPFGTPVKLVTDGATAVWSESETAEVLALEKDGFKAQGFAKETFHIAHSGHVTSQVISFDAVSMQKVFF